MSRTVEGLGCEVFDSGDMLAIMLDGDDVLYLTKADGCKLSDEQHKEIVNIIVDAIEGRRI